MSGDIQLVNPGRWWSRLAGKSFSLVAWFIRNMPLILFDDTSSNFDESIPVVILLSKVVSSMSHLIP